MMMKELYDITVLFLRCLRNLKKWSWILNLRKNEEKWGEMGKNSCPNIPIYTLLSFFVLQMGQAERLFNL